VKKISIRER